MGTRRRPAFPRVGCSRLVFCSVVLRTRLPQMCHTYVSRFYDGAMQHFLSSSQVAERLGLTRDALNAKIRTDAFVEPDVVVGGRYQGWAEETVDEFIESDGGNRVGIDAPKIFAVITSIRHTAEQVRTFGRRPRSEGRDYAYVSIPSDLHMIAGRLEGEARGWLAEFNYHNTYFDESTCDATDITEVPVELDPVLTLVGPPCLPRDIRERELRRAADRLVSAAGEIRLALITKSSRPYQEQLLKFAAQIHELADTVAA